MSETIKLTDPIATNGSFRIGAVPNFAELDKATITARSVGNLAPENLFDPSSFLRYQSVDVSDQLDDVTLVWSEPQWITDVIWQDHNLSDRARVQVLVSETGSFDPDIVRLDPSLAPAIGGADAPGTGFFLAPGASISIDIEARAAASIAQTADATSFRLRARRPGAVTVFSLQITLGTASVSTAFELRDDLSHLVHMPFDPIVAGVGEASFQLTLKNTGGGSLILEGVDVTQEVDSDGIHRSPWRPVWPLWPAGESPFLAEARATRAETRSYHFHLPETASIDPTAARAVKLRIRDGLNPDHHLSARGLLAGGHLRGTGLAAGHGLGELPRVSLLHQEDVLTSLGGAEFIFPGRVRRRLTLPIVSPGAAGFVEIFDAFLRRQRRPVALTLFPGSAAGDVLTIVGRVSGEEHLAEYSGTTPDRLRQEITFLEI